jgi:3-keto-5-aminohexanoate cleavage enzyme
MSSENVIWNYSDPYEYIKRVQNNEMPPLIITAAITGGGAGKEINPNLPETPEEQAKAAYEAHKAGASIIHIHARDETGAEVSTDPAKYREINRRVREVCPDVIVNNTTGGGPGIPREEVIRILEAEPEICSLNMGASNIRFVKKKREAPLRGRPADIVLDAVFPATTGEIERIARICLEKDIKPEMEIYNASMLWGVLNLIRQNSIKKPYWVQLIFSPSFEYPTPKAVINLMDYLPRDSIFSVIGVGPHQLPLTTLSIMLGGHVRVGLEDNLFYQKGELAKSNAQLVERTVRIAKELGREIATPAQAREMLGLSQKPRRW